MERNAGNSTCAVVLAYGMIENNMGVKPKGLGVDMRMFKTTTSFAIGALIIIGLLIALYTVTGKEMIKIGITSNG